MMMFYGLNSQIPKIKNETALREQVDSNFSSGNEVNWLLSQKNKFADDYSGCGTNQSRTFSIILPNLIHQSKKRDL